MLTDRFLRGRLRPAMSEAEKRAIEDAVTDVYELPPRATLVRAGDVLSNTTYLVDGFVSRYMDDREGHRQLVAIHVPGDFIDLHGYALRRLDHDIATLGPVKLATIPHHAVSRIVAEMPHLARVLWFSTLLDAAMHREWIFRLGRLDALGRLAHLFCEMEVRLAMVGLVEDGRFALPLTQSEVAEAIGLTGVHANRTLRALRERGLLTFRDGIVTIHDSAGLRRAADFDPAYLYPDGVALFEGAAA